MKCGVGFSSLDNSRSAGTEAAEAAVSGVGNPKITFVISTDFYDHRDVIRGVIEIVGESEIAGFCSGGIITSDGIMNRGVGILVLEGDELKVASEIEQGISTDPLNKGKTLGEKILKKGFNAGTVFLMPDGLAANISDFIRGLYSVLGPDFQYVGGGTGDDLKFQKSYQFTAGDMASDAAVVGVVDGINIGTAVGHGWQPGEHLVVIGKTDEKRVFEIDGMKAYQKYRDIIGEIPEDEFYTHTMEYPLGFSDAHGNFIIRDPLSIGDDSSIDFVTEVPGNSVGFIMECHIDKLIMASSHVVSKAKKDIGIPKFAFIFDCISRTILMGERFNDELRSISDALGADIPIIGALSFGEVGSFVDIPFFHNKTLAIAIGADK